MGTQKNFLNEVVLLSTQNIIELRHEISNNVVCVTSNASDQPAHTRRLIRAFASQLNIIGVKLLAEHHLDFLSFKRVCTGLSESTPVKLPHCWKSRVTAHIFILMGKKINRGPLHECSCFIELIKGVGKKEIKCEAFDLIHEFNKFNNTRARMLDSIYHMKIRLL